MVNRKKTIIITGASSGLGRALAINYADNSTILYLFGRSATELEETARRCKKNGADTIQIIADVTDKDKMQQELGQIASTNQIDILIACAGVSAGTLKGPETSWQVEKIFSVNLNGVLNTIMPIIPHMVQNRSGKIAIISSMAGLIGLSSAPSYSASKGAVRLFADGIRGTLKQYGINVSTVIPGYITTPMTAVNKFPMPFKISAELAARKIISGIENNKQIIVFPFIIYLLLKMLNLLPASILTYINTKLPGKPAFDL